jgi:hypothetical protein
LEKEFCVFAKVIKIATYFKKLLLSQEAVTGPRLHSTVPSARASFYSYQAAPAAPEKMFPWALLLNNKSIPILL